MKRSLVLLATLAALMFVPDRAMAQRSGRGTVNTPFGQFNMSDMRAAGGNPFAAEQIREQRMMMVYQQQLLRQQQLAAQKLANQNKARQAAAKKVAGTTTPSPAPVTKQATSASAKTKAAPKAATTKNATTDTTKSSNPKVPGAPSSAFQ